MKLHQALTIAKRFLDVKAGFDGVRLTHGTVEAGTDAHGVRILVPDLVLGSREITVNAAMPPSWSPSPRWGTSRPPTT